MSRLGTYRYSYAVAVYPTLKLERFSLRVEILSETLKRYKVKYLEFHADRSKPGKITNVNKTSIILDEPKLFEVPVRLPYAD